MNTEGWLWEGTKALCLPSVIWRKGQESQAETRARRGLHRSRDEGWTDDVQEGGLAVRTGSREPGEVKDGERAGSARASGAARLLVFVK